ncbi:MAG: galactokinase, partial [Gammaproteobacteria bacterium]|nr:galactokinase [Gammaproteobacteria bacterium]
RHSAKIVVCNSMVKHRHAGGEYNLRRSECERGLDSLRAAWAADPAAGRGRLESLRDVDAPLLEAHRACLDEVSLRRCRHVVGENARVLAAAAALERGDPLAFGACMYASHASLRDDYAVSCPELDLLVELASSVDGVYGARMTGGGFGGCTVNLIRAEALARFGGRVVDGYRRATGVEPEIYVCNSADGASLLEAA